MWITFRPVDNPFVDRKRRYDAFFAWPFFGLADILEGDVHGEGGAGKQFVLEAVQGAFFVFDKEFLHAENVATKGLSLFKEGFDFPAELFFRSRKNTARYVAEIGNFL